MRVSLPCIILFSRQGSQRERSPHLLSEEMSGPEKNLGVFSQLAFPHWMQDPPSPTGSAALPV